MLESKISNLKGMVENRLYKALSIKCDCGVAMVYMYGTYTHFSFKLTKSGFVFSHSFKMKYRKTTESKLIECLKKIFETLGEAYAKKLNEDLNKTGEVILSVNSIISINKKLINDCNNINLTETEK